jgi:hypothetical protein
MNGRAGARDGGKPCTNHNGFCRGPKVCPEHDPEKHALGLDPWVDFRFSEKTMLQLES